MQVRSDRVYRFDVPPEDLWRRLGDVGSYRSWWPWLRRFDAAALEPGASWECAVQPPLPYVLRFTIVLDEVVEERRVGATIDGDISGTACIDIGRAGGGTELRLRSSLAPANRYLRTVARVARPVVRFGHDWVLDTGARQFRRQAL
jgi:uncharacterized protein YndB with AHSA1/START domain